MMESKLKKLRIIEEAEGDASDKVDRISNLPEPILHYILSFLQTIDVISTSILSRRWRFLWTSMPYLDFDVEAFLFARYDESSMNFREVIRAFEDFINWVLINGSSNIQKFRLSCSDIYDSRKIVRLVLVATRRNVQELDLKCHLSEPFELPSCLVTCKSLRVLKLNLSLQSLRLNCLSYYRGFALLKSLELLLVELSEEDLTRNLFSRCPLLESLRLADCILNKLKVLHISATSLKYLTISNTDLSLPDEGLCKSELKVSCPNLVSFNYLGPIAQDYSLENLSSLRYAFIYLIQGYGHVFEEVGYLMRKVLKGLYHTTVLILCPIFSETLYLALDDATWFSTPLFNLKSLKLSVGIDGSSMDVMIFLLKHSFNLEALTLIFEQTYGDMVYRELKDETIECLKYSLGTVELFGFEGNESQLEVVRFLLKNGYAMENLSITWAPWVEKSLEIIEMVTKFPISSEKVALTFLEPKLEIDLFSLWIDNLS